MVRELDPACPNEDPAQPNTFLKTKQRANNRKTPATIIRHGCTVKPRFAVSSIWRLEGALLDSGVTVFIQSLTLCVNRHSGSFFGKMLSEHGAAWRAVTQL